jgi:hypothetical protein
MAKPRIFISSTYYDLKHIRSSIENFIETLGYEPVLSEKGSIAYNPDIPLDESCYREAQSCDVFVLLIGGRYGSPSSDQNHDLTKDFYDRYESITKKEFGSAFKREIPVYILVDQAVYSEYDTFKSNRKNKDIKYAHVDSINVFYFLDEILSQPRNNPIQKFEKHSDIETWLKEQWAGLFKELISNRSNQKELDALSKQIDDLSNINTTLKRYLEEIVSNVSEIKGKELILQEDQRLEEQKQINQFMENEFVAEVNDIGGVDQHTIIRIFQTVNSLDELASQLKEVSPSLRSDLVEFWKENGREKVLNDARMKLGLSNLEYEETKKKQPRTKAEKS